MATDSLVGDCITAGWAATVSAVLTFSTVIITEETGAVCADVAVDLADALAWLLGPHPLKSEILANAKAIAISIDRILGLKSFIDLLGF